MIYKQQRNWENLQRARFPGVGPYEIPELRPVRSIPDDLNWISFNYARSCDERSSHAVHFFVDDYQFNRVWTDPDKYTEMLSEFAVVCTPDFSPYSDFPRAVQIWNHYRKHWVGAYWQMHGLLVIPTITWSDPSTLDWCFDGEPSGGIVAMSSVGMFLQEEYLRWLMQGYEQMMKKLAPIKIIWRGKIPPELEPEREAGRILQIPSFVDKWHENRK